ncbi:MAG: glycosidase [Chitinivibrionales bacterium]|nr:glycosidase [Chitinivibrionales bacterium]
MSLQRLEAILKPSQERVLVRPFIPLDENKRSRIIARVMTLTEEQVRHYLKNVITDFTQRHQNIKDVLLQHFEKVEKWTVTDTPLSEERRLLIGAYFTQEYSLESAALFNPSIVLHPDQSDLPSGAIRFIMSLRATGEGHISSIVFREGIITDNFKVKLRRPTTFVTEPVKIPNKTYDKDVFARKLGELEFENYFSRHALSTLPENFTLNELKEVTNNIRRENPGSGEAEHTVEGMLSLAYSNYEVTFEAYQRTSEKTIFPSTATQRNGIEDARFVRFVDDDGSTCYYGTFTAFDGKTVIPELLRTEDFVSFRFITLNGPAVKNKGMALFPRKINGNYAMLSRQDNENLFIMYSDNIHFWYDPHQIAKPTFPWEYVQLGNCGSPVEIDEGWLVLSHGVGPMREYCIGAFLLDKNIPSNIIGRLREPLLAPNENERAGYVPNVVYTCGALLHKGKLIIPYAMSDYATSFALADIKEIVGAMEWK